MVRVPDAARRARARRLRAAQRGDLLLQLLRIGNDALLFGLDVAGLRSLVAQSPVGWVAASALTFLLCLTFGSVQMGIAVMQLESNDTQRGSRRRALFGLVPQPVLVPVRVRQRSR